MKTALVIGGGGFLGLLEMQELRRLNIDLQSIDLFVGTSVGAICAYALSCGLTYKQIEDFYLVDGKVIFKKQMLSGNGFFRAKYDTKNLQSVLKKLLSPLINVKPMMCNAVNLTTNSSKYFKTEQGDDMTNAIVASCSAPTYFDTYKFDGNTYCDGGIENNLLCDSAYTELQAMFGFEEDIRIISISIQDYQSYPVTLSGMSSWIPFIIGLFMKMNTYSEEYKLRSRLRKNDTFKNIKIDNIDKLEMDDISKIEKKYLENNM